MAVQFVLNYEEGAENSVLHGDTGSEQFLSDIIGAASYPDRHMSMESLYEYGSRAGFWRIHNEFQKRGLPLTVFSVAMALARHPEVVEAIKQADYDVVSHGWRWIHYQGMDAKTERQHMQQAVDVLVDLFGKAPTGWYTGRDSRIPGGWWWSRAVSAMTVTTTATICLSGPRSPVRMVRLNRT